jgi:hypothetical protein
MNQVCAEEVLTIEVKKFRFRRIFKEFPLVYVCLYKIFCVHACIYVSMFTCAYFYFTAA